MLLKRHFREVSADEATHERRRDGKPIAVSHIEIQRLGTHQNLTQKYIDMGVSEGWMTLAKGRITITTEDGEPDLELRIIRKPGHYCCHCNAPLGDSNEGRAHLEKEHEVTFTEKELQVKGRETPITVLVPSVPSPDPNNPAGWRKDNFFACEVVTGRWQNHVAPHLRAFVRKEV